MTRSLEAFDLETVRERVGSYRPAARPAGDSAVWAATALIVAGDRRAPDVAFIKRSTRAGDRWSGQMALPGGRRDATDVDAVHTAVRETREEIGVSLPAPVGRLDDVRGRVTAGIVATFVFTLEERPALRPSPEEVDAALWIPLRTLLSVEAAHRLPWSSGHFPAISHEGYVIWGLTHRILESFAQALGVELPPAPQRA